MGALSANHLKHLVNDRRGKSEAALPPAAPFLPTFESEALRVFVVKLSQ